MNDIHTGDRTMLLKKIAKKSIAIFIVFLLLLSFNFSLNVTAKLDIDEFDGVAFDDFDTDEDITYINCNYSKGSIKLDYGAHNITYDCKVTPEKVEAWKLDPLLIKPGDEGVGGFLSKFLSLDQLTGDEFSSNEYEDLWYADNNVVETEALVGYYDEPNWPLNLFRFDLDFNKDIVDTFTVDWYFGDFKEDTNLEEIYMFVWSYGDLLPRWREFDVGSYPDIVNTTLNTVLGKKYSNDDGLIDVLIVGKPKELRQYTYLYTDYVKLEITISEGYLPNGNVTSTLIQPATLKGWEQVIWSGSRPSTNSWVKIQVLDENNNVIKALDGNSEGFTTSPIDISTIDVDVYSKIKLRALLHSENLEFTPRLNNWGVLWQTKSGFYDSFRYDYRIDESYGINIERGEIKVSDFYSDWLIFGKNSENTRSYIGQKLKIGKNQTYWFTEDELDIGGGFRSPVVKDGKVYVASETNRIYALNLTTENPDDEHLPFDVSDADYKVDNSLAVADNLVIVGTGDTGENNVIYALNASNLTQVMWYFEYDENDKPICYSGAPTIANDRIFITSWSGKFRDNPILSYLFSWLNTQLQKLGVDLGINNKLIALDLDGNEIWDPIDLPASSYCTPAVHNGLVYVGCENYQGSSLFAFDENTGEEIWNASIGLIGKSAPVVADGKVFVLSREQSLFALKGDDKVSALDAETGEMLWNKTIGNDTTIIGNVLKGYGYDNLIATSSPVSTPAYYQGTLFVMSINGVLFAIDSETGEEKWTFNSTEYTKGADFIPYHTASPVVVDDIVYIATTDYAIITENAFVYALDNSNNGDILWDYQILDPIYDPAIPQRHLLLASPIVTDGLVLLSENRWVSAKQEHEGRIQCVGEYSKNSMGILYSVPVHVQKGKWWDKFNAVTENTEENNTITFEILDGNGEPFNGFGNLNGTDNDISGIKENVIQLCAHLTIGNSSEPLPLLKSWEILWSTEDQAPEFIDSSFEPGQEGWINLNLKNCSIEVEDRGVDNVISGLDTSSAKYQLEYVKEGSDTPVTEWFDAVCDQESGALKTKMTARISEDLTVEVTDLRNITFSIKDLAGNEATSGTVTFKIDNDKPTSSIKDPDDFESKYIEPVTIEAEGDDDVGGSGVVKIALYYRPTGSSDWLKYKPDEETLDDPPHVWSFEINVSDSYEFTTIATDKANNKEDLPSNGEVSFLFDMNKPPKPDYKEEYYFNTLPVFSGNNAITFTDDYQLEKVEYQLDIHGENEWILIADNINDDSYSEDWGLTQSDWDTLLEDETHLLFFRITDYCGNVYQTPTEDAIDITKDTTPPIAENVSLDLSGYDGGGDDEFTITANIPDGIDVSYVTLEYSYSPDDSKWNEWKQYGDNIGDGPYTWDFKAGDGSGYYKFRITIFDEAGNFVQSPIKSVNITIFPTTLTLLLVILIIVLFAFTIIVIRKMSKKKE